MARKTLKKAVQDMLEDLDAVNFDKFCRQLVDRRAEPRARRGRVLGKSFLDVADVLVNTFTEEGAVEVAVELLRQIDCQEDAKRLLEETSGGSSTQPNPSDTDRTPVVTPAQPNPSDNLHFVDKHQVELKQRVNNLGVILDELLSREVLTQETYDRIRALPTKQEKMRELYAGPLQAARVCKNIFYEILEKYEKYLIEDLKSQ